MPGVRAVRLAGAVIAFVHVYSNCADSFDYEQRRIGVGSYFISSIEALGWKSYVI